MKCQYIFKRGKFKGNRCNNNIPKLSQNLGNGESSFCSTHKIYLNCDKKQKVIIISNKSPEDRIKDKILNLKTTDQNKNIILKHYNNLKRLDSNSTEYYKNQVFIDLSLSYPWDKQFDIKNVLQNFTIPQFINTLQNNLDKEIYGMSNVKNEIINIICKLITNPNSSRNNIALYGSAGVGKSKFINILAKTLGIPMKIISLGGIKDSSFFLGHSYVYVESGPGKIVQNIIDSKISNPIIYFDELDKISDTEHGKDVESFLSYLTDPTQNTQFSDHYFYGMTFDLSKIFYVFTFNDITKINKILLDRLNVIHIETPSNQEIAVILHNYCLNEIKTNIGINYDIIFDIKYIKQIIQFHHSSIDLNFSSGIREYYRILEKIFLELNKEILLSIVFPENDQIIISDDLFNRYFEKTKHNNLILYNNSNSNTSLYI
jgi:ATP-dependent Lon protease